MRYRGPLEYDKFILNTLQFHNEIYDLIAKEFEKPDESVGDLTEVQQLVNDMFYLTTGKTDLQNPLKSITGFSESFYLNMLDMKEC
jgi:hypothetical protein